MNRLVHFTFKRVRRMSGLAAGRLSSVSVVRRAFEAMPLDPP